MFPRAKLSIAADDLSTNRSQINNKILQPDPVMSHALYIFSGKKKTVKKRPFKKNEEEGR